MISTVSFQAKSATLKQTMRDWREGHGFNISISSVFSKIYVCHMTALGEAGRRPLYISSLCLIVHHPIPACAHSAFTTNPELKKIVRYLFLS